MIEKELTVFSTSLTSRIVDAVGKLNGVELEMLRDLPEIKWYDDLVWMKRAYDFDLTVILHASGKELMATVDWQKAFERAREFDAILQQIVRKMEELWKNNKQKILEEQIRATLEFAAMGSNSIANILKSDYSEIGLSEEEVLAKLARSVEESVKGRISTQEIRTMLEKKLEEGKFKLAAITIYGVEGKT